MTKGKLMLDTGFLGPRRREVLKHEHKDTNFFYKTKLLIIGKYFHPFEHIEPFEQIQPQKPHKPHKPLKPTSSSP